MPDDSVDVLVVGAGMAGLCAALTASQSGAKVVVVEKGTRFGGSMLLSGGLIWTCKDRSRLADDIPNGNKPLQEMVIDHVIEFQDWLLQQGVQLEAPRNFQWYGRGRYSAPTQMTPALVERLEAAGGRISLRTGMQDLLAEGGEVVGARVFHDGRARDIRARSIILATGGFQGNAELVGRYITPFANAMYLRANPWSTGDGLMAAVAAGAAVTPHMNEFYGHALAAPPGRFGPFEFLNVTQRYGPFAVALNLNGQRFADESMGTGEEALNFAIASQPDATAVYIVDADVAAGRGTNGGVPSVAIDRARKCGAPVMEAATLEELAEKLQGWGIPSSASRETLRTYNAAIAADQGASLSPARLKNALALKAAPFTAVLVRAGITFTCGGLQADLDMNVLRRASTASTLALVTADVSELELSPIANLYAAGCDLGGISTRDYMGGLATALVTGRFAGQAASKNAN